MVRVRPAKISDVDAIYNIEIQTFSDAWTRESFVTEIEDNDVARYYVAELDGNVVAYIGYWQILDQAHITNVAVLSDYRGRGIAKKLLEKLFDEAKKENTLSYTLECRVSNTVAISLYESVGFKSWGIRPKYYLDNNEDAVIMWLESGDIETC